MKENTGQRCDQHFSLDFMSKLRVEQQPDVNVIFVKLALQQSDSKSSFNEISHWSATAMALWAKLE